LDVAAVVDVAAAEAEARSVVVIAAAV